MTTILVVEQNPSTAESMRRELRRQGYDTRSASTGGRAMETYRDADLILLSLDLPDVDGLELCRGLRSSSDVPLIARTHHDNELERILALREGADDCVSLDWGFREIGARIDAVLRRCSRGTGRSSAQETLMLDPLVLDPRTQEVRMDGRPIHVTSKEFDLLYALAANPDTVLSRKELMANVWGTDWAYSSRTIDTHVSSLRAKLGSARWIMTVRGVGYRIGQAWPTPAGATN